MIKILIFFLFFHFYSCNKEINLIKLKENSQSKNNALIPNSFNSTNNIAKKNLILGIIMRYSLNIILPFFKSLILVKFKNCDVVMFVKNVSKSVIIYLKSIGVVVYWISNKYANLPVQSYRWKLYIDFLIKKKNEYNLIYIADIRDTIFQRNIFQFYKTNKSFLGVALEDGTLNEKLNKKWIINFAGEEKHKVIMNEKIICFGSLWGTLDKILGFSIILWKYVKFNTNSSDQGIGNYLIYYEKIFNDCIIKSDNFGPVMTIGLTERQNISLDLNDNILNFRREKAAVIHQYDRKSDIYIKVKKKFLSNNKIKIPFINQRKISINKTETSNNKFNGNMQSYTNRELVFYKNIVSHQNIIIYFLIISQFFVIILLLKIIIYLCSKS